MQDQYLTKVRRIAQHEMGHYLASRHFGFPTGDVTVQVYGLTSGHRGGATIQLHVPLRSLPEIDEYLCRRIIILYAGALSETLSLGAPVKAVGDDENSEAIGIVKDPQSGAHIDYAKVRELIYLLRNIRFPETPPDDLAKIEVELTTLDEELWTRTREIVDLYYLKICGLAENLTKRLKEYGAEACITAAELEQIPAVVEIVPV